MLRYFYRGALHGLILGTLACGIIAAGLHGTLRSEAEARAASKASIDASAHRHAQKVFPLVAATGP